MRWEEVDEMEVEMKGEGEYEEEEAGYDNALKWWKGINRPGLTSSSMDEMGVGGVDDQNEGRGPGEGDGLNMHGHGDGLAAYLFGYSAGCQ